MSDQENSIVGVTPKRALSSQRRLQNRVAQQRFRERQKSNAAANAEQANTTTLNSLDAIDTADSDDLYMYHPREPTIHTNTDRPSSLGSNHATLQWHMPPIPSVAPSPQMPHAFDAMLDTSMTPNPSHLDFGFEGLFSSTAPINATTSASASPLYRSPVASYSPNGSSPSSSTSSMGQVFTSQASGMCYQSSQTKPPLLHVAIRTRNKSMVQLLLRRGVSNVNEQDGSGRTALHVAAQSGDGQMVETLVKHGADPRAVDMNGVDPLHCAVEEGHEAIVEILLDALPQGE